MYDIKKAMIVSQVGIVFSEHGNKDSINLLSFSENIT